MGRKAILAALAVTALAVTAYLILNRPQPPAIAPAPAVPAAAPAISGNYADDWQTKCGPLTGTAQADCTTKLDVSYGRQAEQPVPKY